MLTDIHTHHTNNQNMTCLISCSMPGITADTLTAQQYLSLSLHPWYLTPDNMEPQLEWIEKNLGRENVLAIGEAGLDKVCAVPLSLQIEAFRKVIGIAEAHRRPLIIHAVRTSNEIIRLKHEIQPAQPWIIHGFRGKPELMEDYVRHGFYLSFGEKYQTGALEAVPIERMFLETDESSVGIDLLYAQAARVRNTSYEALRQAISNNVSNVFFNH